MEEEDKIEETQNELITSILGWNGTMISGSKSGYRSRFPNNLAVFNSNVCTSKGKIWYGDIDVTKSLDKLKELANKLGETIYVLSEMDARFENEAKPLLDKAIVKIDKDGKIILREKYKL